MLVVGNVTSRRLLIQIRQDLIERHDCGPNERGLSESRGPYLTTSPVDTSNQDRAEPSYRVPTVGVCAPTEGLATPPSWVTVLPGQLATGTSAVATALRLRTALTFFPARTSRLTDVAGEARMESRRTTARGDS